MAKLGSESGAMLLASVWRGWHDVVDKCRQVRQHAERIFAVSVEGGLELVLHSCWGVWRDARRDGKIERERGRQKELAAKALLSMVGDQDFLLSQTCLSAWKEELVHVRRAREQEESELRLHAEVCGWDVPA